MATTLHQLDPDIAKAQYELTAALQAWVDEMPTHSGFTGVVAFVADAHHKADAGSAGVAYPRGVKDATLNFNKRAVAGKRVSLDTTTVGETFRTGQSQFLPSKMNPGKHLVYGLRDQGQHQHPMVYQLAYDTGAGDDLHPAALIDDLYAKHRAALTSTSGALVRQADRHRSLADALLLDTPITPNAVIVKWDVVGSHVHAKTAYPLLRHFLNEAESVVSDSVASNGGTILRPTGDGQNIAFRLPTSVDPNDSTATQNYNRHTVLPVIALLTQSLEVIGNRYGITSRVSHSLGHIEQSHSGDATGPVLFELSAK